MLDFCHDLIRDYIIIKYAGKNFKVTRIPDIRTRVLGHNYNYMIKIMIKMLI